jgi:hypothetical protein
MISREAHVAQIAQLFTAVDRGSNGSGRVSLVYNTLTSRNPTSKPLLPTQPHTSTAASSFPASPPLQGNTKPSHGRQPLPPRVALSSSAPSSVLRSSSASHSRAPPPPPCRAPPPCRTLRLRPLRAGSAGSAPSAPDPPAPEAATKAEGEEAAGGKVAADAVRSATSFDRLLRVPSAAAAAASTSTRRRSGPRPRFPPVPAPAAGR